jgi:hypothetical protein
VRATVKVRPIQSILEYFEPDKKARVLERAWIVAEKGAKGPIFEWNMLPQKMNPQIGANIGAITGILLIDSKSLGWIWSFGEDSMTL